MLTMLHGCVGATLAVSHIGGDTHLLKLAEVQAAAVLVLVFVRQLLQQRSLLP
jgi:hypothetical protein